MQKVARIARSVPASAASGRLVVWNQRLLTAATVFILWAATILALQAAGPVHSAMLAGEGASVVSPAD